MKSICLVGFGAEIGATLLGMNKPDIDGYEINDVITRAPIWDDTPPIQSIFARLCMAVPRLWGALEIIDDSHIKIHGRKVKFHFLDLHKDNFLNNYKLKSWNTYQNIKKFSSSSKGIGELSETINSLEEKDFVVFENDKGEFYLYY